MYYFATLFDKNYLNRGLALYQSMQLHIEHFTLFVLALDQSVFVYIKHQNKENLKGITLNDLEIKYPELVEAKSNRSTVEYYFTLSPVLPLYVLETYPDIDFITTLDADIFLFNSPKRLFDTFENYSIIITAHDFASNLKHLEIYGKYNVSFQSFRRDSEGLACLNEWKKQCLKWCFDRLDDDKFADQKYLDSWNSEFIGVLELSGKGVGIAPWNISKYKIRYKKKTVYCDEHPLIFYHFHGLRLINSKWFKHNLRGYKVTINSGIKNILYKTYLEILLQVSKGNLSNEQSQQRIIIHYTKAELKNILIKGYFFYYIFSGHFYYLFSRHLININLQPFLLIYKVFKYIFMLTSQILKRSLNK